MLSMRMVWGCLSLSHLHSLTPDDNAAELNEMRRDSAIVYDCDNVHWMRNRKLVAPARYWVCVCVILFMCN